jgi:phage-related protein
MTEEQYRDVKAWFSGKTIADLIFDEAPYKVYKAKVTGNATIKHIPFGKQGERIYKGEGNV